MREGFEVITNFETKGTNSDCILVDNWQQENEIKNWHYSLSDAYSEKGDGYSIGVWKIKQLKK